MAKKSQADNNFDKLHSYLRQTRNFVPAGGLLSKVEAACQKRIAELNLGSVSQYIDHMEVTPDEIKQLLDSALSEQPCLFRGEKQWQFLKSQLIPRIGSRKLNSALRCWTIHCGAGYDTYSLAILLCETLGQSVFQAHVKIFATDTEDEKLHAARQAIYTEEETRAIPEELKSRYFVQAGKKFVFRNDLRRSIIFGKHSLLDDPCLSRMDLIMCGHALCYMNIENQKRAWSRLRFSLREDGCMLLGDGECLPAESGFGEVNSEPKVFVRMRDRQSASEDGHEINKLENDALVHTNEAVFDSSPIAQIAIDRDGVLATANSRARIVFGLSNQDFGRPFQDLEISYRPIELRSLMEQCVRKNKTVVTNRVSRHTANGRAQFFDVYVQPMIDNGNRVGICVQFDDVTEFYEMQDQLGKVNQQLQTANEELQSAHEELETINEELQSTNEELETTNEELQSTNEELETTNEELQSTNAELETANLDQQRLATTVEQTNSFLQSILSSMQSCVIVLNEKYQVMVWNDYCRELWGLRADEVKGHSLFDLDIGLPVDKLKTPLRTFISLKKTSDEITVDAVNRRGRMVTCKIRVTPLANPMQPGLILLIEDQQ